MVILCLEKQRENQMEMLAAGSCFNLLELEEAQRLLLTIKLPRGSTGKCTTMYYVVMTVKKGSLSSCYVWSRSEDMWLMWFLRLHINIFLKHTEPVYGLSPPEHPTDATLVCTPCRAVVKIGLCGVCVPQAYSVKIPVLQHISLNLRRASVYQEVVKT